MKRPPQIRAREGGFVLMLSLVMLVAITILAAAAIRAGATNLRAVTNQQVREESLAAAQQAIEQVISSNFARDATALATARAAAPTIRFSDDKSYDIAFDEGAICLVSIVPLKNQELNLNDEDDAKCYHGGTLNSDCARTVWQLTARATNSFFGAGVSVTQAVGIKMDYSLALGLASDATNICAP